MLSAKHARNLRGGLFAQQTMNKTYRNNMTNMTLIRPTNQGCIQSLQNYLGNLKHLNLW